MMIHDKCRSLYNAREVLREKEEKTDVRSFLHVALFITIPASKV